MALAPRVRLGPYEIVSALGAGGMGEANRATDARLDHTVAIKVLPEEFAHERRPPSKLIRSEKSCYGLAATSAVR